MKMIGVGLYTFQEAAKLIDASAQELRRWLNGGHNNAQDLDTRVSNEPLWQTELIESEVQGISFHDLLEVRFVKAFRKHGVTLQTIRLASRNARELFENPYPFTSKRFRTDGRSIFADALEESGETELLDIGKRQYAFAKIIESSLYHGIEFGSDELALRWYPMQRSKAVVLDPAIAFGKPIVANEGIRTSILYDAFRAEQSKPYVAKIYDVPIAAVEAAIRFEERLAA